MIETLASILISQNKLEILPICPVGTSLQVNNHTKAICVDAPSQPTLCPKGNAHLDRFGILECDLGSEEAKSINITKSVVDLCNQHPEFIGIASGRAGKSGVYKVRCDASSRNSELYHSKSMIGGERLQSSIDSLCNDYGILIRNYRIKNIDDKEIILSITCRN